MEMGINLSLLNITPPKLSSVDYNIITLHAQCERGKVIGYGVHIYQRVR